MFSFLCFILWIVSIIMMFVEYHWGWLVAFIITTLYLIARFGGGGGGSFDFDFDLFD